MERVIFACVSGVADLDRKVPILAASIRQFAGILSDCPIWVLVPKTENEIPEKTKTRLVAQNVQLIPFTVDEEVRKFPFAALVRAAATVESLAKEKTELLAWILLLLDAEKNLGYRPVHHTLVGSLYEEPVDAFWELVYRKCIVPEEKLFPMKTHVDGNTLRPYFNAGFLIVRPEKGVLQAWWDAFEKLYRDPDFETHYAKNQLYTIFIHQAVLAGVILSMLDRQELQELPFSYNYPLHLYSESAKEYRPQNISDLITARYEDPETLEKVPLQDPLKSWVGDLRASLAQE
ncbi:MAG: hypothetical protein ACXADX_07935 [Candidatus Hodarchaeales archaeon]|jgi:hypothetical protein